MSDDKWFVDAGGTIRAGLILHGNIPTPVGDPVYLPRTYGEGKGKLVKKLVEPEDCDNEAADPRVGRH